MKWLLFFLLVTFLSCKTNDWSSREVVIDKKKLYLSEFILSKTNNQDTLISIVMGLDSPDLYLKIKEDIPINILVRLRKENEVLHCDIIYKNDAQRGTFVQRKSDGIWELSTLNDMTSNKARADRSCAFLLSDNKITLMNNLLNEKSTVRDLMYSFGKGLKKSSDESLLYTSIISDSENVYVSEFDEL